MPGGQFRVSEACDEHVVVVNFDVFRKRKGFRGGVFDRKFLIRSAWRTGDGSGNAAAFLTRSMHGDSLRKLLRVARLVAVSFCPFLVTVQAPACNANMERVWRLLPDTILESKILPFVPIASLCRFRAVCKKWNTDISKRDFAALVARAPPPEERVLITVQEDSLVNGMRGWDIMDVAQNKVITLREDFLFTYVPSNMARRVLATDGGLILVEFYPYRAPREGPDVLLVCNPVLKSVKVLPPSPGVAARVEKFGNVVMSTDRVSMEYKIMVLHQQNLDYQTYTVDIYESRTGSWRNVVHPTAAPSRISWRVESKFVKLDVLYRLYRSQNVYEPSLVAYDPAGRGTSELRFTLPSSLSSLVDHAQLVVSGHRLYCVSRIRWWRCEVYEVNPVQLKCRKCAVVPSETMVWLFGDDRQESRTDAVWDRCLVSTGCASSILICSCVGRCVRYDMVEKSWHRHTYKNKARYNPNSPNVFISNFCCSLCPP